jgi:hypothetical protein
MSAHADTGASDAQCARRERSMIRFMAAVCGGDRHRHKAAKKRAPPGEPIAPRMRVGHLVTLAQHTALANDREGGFPRIDTFSLTPKAELTRVASTLAEAEGAAEEVEQLARSLHETAARYETAARSETASRRARGTETTPLVQAPAEVLEELDELRVHCGLQALELEPKRAALVGYHACLTDLIRRAPPQRPSVDVGVQQQWDDVMTSARATRTKLDDRAARTEQHLRLAARAFQEARARLDPAA